MTAEEIIPKFNQLSDNLKVEVLHFIEFLQTRKNETFNPYSNEKRIFGISKGKFTLGPKFDEPLDDFKEYM